MKHPLFIALTIAMVLGAAAGCAHKGSDDRAAVWKSRYGSGSSRLTKLEDSRFETAESTNRIESAWLTSPTNLYTLGPGDSLDIESLGEPVSTTPVTVGPDGRIYYSLLPGTSVWGMTLAESKQALQTGMQKYFRSPPELVVNLRSVRSKNVWLLGNVNRPGLHPMPKPLTVLEAIAAAGGTLQTPGSRDGICDLKRSFIMRGGQPLPVDLERLLRNGDLSQNIYLQPDDFLFLRSSVIQSVYVLGAVRLPQVVPFSDRISLGAAIMGAGGNDRLRLPFPGGDHPRFADRPESRGDRRDGYPPWQSQGHRVGAGRHRLCALCSVAPRGHDAGSDAPQLRPHGGRQRGLSCRGAGSPGPIAHHRTDPECGIGHRLAGTRLLASGRPGSDRGVASAGGNRTITSARSLWTPGGLTGTPTSGLDRRAGES